MALNIKNEQVERLATEVARIAGETKTEAIRRALEDRKMRLAFRAGLQDRTTQMKEYLEQEVWPQLPAGARRKKMTKREREAILGFGPSGFSE
jgi:antitoxin VapB